jgi:hypothetical protein
MRIVPVLFACPPLPYRPETETSNVYGPVESMKAR